MKRVGIEENQDTWDVVTWECVRKKIADFAGRFLESRDRVSGQGLGKSLKQNVAGGRNLFGGQSCRRGCRVKKKTALPFA